MSARSSPSPPAAPELAKEPAELSARSAMSPTDSWARARIPWRPVPGDPLEIMAMGPREILFRPCVDCGLWTGYFCDWCEAADRMPGEEWAEGQFTPLCTYCEGRHGKCHFCRQQKWCTPPATYRVAPCDSFGPESESASGLPETESASGLPEAESASGLPEARMAAEMDYEPRGCWGDYEDYLRQQDEYDRERTAHVLGWHGPLPSRARHGADEDGVVYVEGYGVSSSSDSEEQ